MPAKRSLRLITAALIVAGLVAIGLGAYLALMAPKVSIITVSPGHYELGMAVVGVYVENYGRVHVSAKIICDVRYPGDEETYSGDLAFELDPGQMEIFYVYIEVPSFHLYEEAYIYCDLTDVRG